MNTSLRINDQLWAAAKQKAARDHTTVEALIEAGLSRVLGPDAPKDPDYDTRLCEGLCALPDLDDLSDDVAVSYMTH